MLRAIVLIQILLGSPARAQELVAKPCVISENVKGSCFYDANGEIVYWIAREWSDVSLGGGPGSSEEFVGYPGALKAQQTYNRLIMENQEAGLLFATPSKKKPNYGSQFSPRPQESISEQIQYLKDAIRSGGHAPIKETHNSLRGTKLREPRIFYGWRADRVDPDRWRDKIYQWSLIAPAHIEERGDLNPNTLRIPFFLAGAELLAAKQRLVKACRAATTSVDNSGERWKIEWTPNANWPTQSRRDWDGFCRMGQSRNPNFAGLHRVLLDRLARLDAAAEISRHIDKTIDAQLGLHGETRPLVNDQDLAALADRLALLQSSMEEDLRLAVGLEPVSARLQMEFDAFIERERKAKLDSLKENAEESIKRGEASMREYYKRFPNAR